MSHLGKNLRVRYLVSQGMPGDDGANPMSLSLQAVSLQTQPCPWAVLSLENTWVQLLCKFTSVSLNTSEFIIMLDMPRGWWGSEGERWISPVSVLAGPGSHWPARDLFPLLMFRNEGYLNASSYIVLPQEKWLHTCWGLPSTLLCLFLVRWWMSMCQTVVWSCIHLEQLPISALLPSYRKTRESCMGKKSIWNHRDLLQEGESFK